MPMSRSRRDFLATSAAAALGVAFGRPLAGFAQQQQAAQPVFTPVRRNVGTFTMRGGTVGWLVNPRGVAVVDTQFPAEARVLLEGLQTRSSNRGVDVLLNTHHHGDHTSGNPVFRGVAKRVVAHGMADQHMRRGPSSSRPRRHRRSSRRRMRPHHSIPTRPSRTPGRPRWATSASSRGIMGAGTPAAMP